MVSWSLQTTHSGTWLCLEPTGRPPTSGPPDGDQPQPGLSLGLQLPPTDPAQPTWPPGASSHLVRECQKGPLCKPPGGREGGRAPSLFLPPPFLTHGSASGGLCAWPVSTASGVQGVEFHPHSARRPSSSESELEAQPSVQLGSCDGVCVGSGPALGWGWGDTSPPTRLPGGHGWRALGLLQTPSRA